MFYNYPGPIAESEAKKLFAEKINPLVVSVGCGIQLSTRSSESSSWLSYKNSFLYRFYQSSMRNLEAHQQYEKFRLNGNNGSYRRLDPHIDMPETSLDDVEIIQTLQEKTTAALQVDAAYRVQLEDTAWLLVSSLFYFEFDDDPRPQKSGLSCSGTISCRYPNDERLLSRLKLLYKDRAFFYIHKKSFKFKVPCRIHFTLERLQDILNISLKYNRQIASISGLPDTAQNIIMIQKRYTRGSLRYPLKRSCREAQLEDSESRVKRLRPMTSQLCPSQVPSPMVRQRDRKMTRWGRSLRLTSTPLPVNALQRLSRFASRQ